MPASHADFLSYVSLSPSLRLYVHSHPYESSLTEAYNAAVTSLSQFRDRHIQIVSRYVIIPSRTKSKVYEEKTVRNLASASMKVGSKEGSKDGPELLHGTGGTQLMPFLRQTRDETKQALRVTLR